MTRGRITFGTAAVALLISLGTLGCTQDEPVVSGNGRLLIAASVLSPPASRWDISEFQLERAFVRPLDPAAATNLGSDPSSIEIDVVASRAGFDLRDQNRQAFFETPLAPGRYALLSLWWYGPVLSDPDASPDAPTCIEKIRAIPPSFATGVKVVAQPTFFTPPLEFSVPSGSSAQIVVEVNGAGLVADFETRFFCYDEEFERCGAEAAPCLGPRGGLEWDSFGFQQAIPQYVTVRVE